MSRLTRNSTASLIMAAALAGAGCGSSSHSKAGAPATLSTPAATSPSATTGSPTNVPESAAVSGPAFRAVLVSQAEHNGAPASQAPRFVDCLIRQLQAAGVTTAGDFKHKQDTVRTVVRACNKSVGVNVKP
jgi:hypothetical protein